MSEHAHQEFRALIERAQRGDEQAFSALYTLWYTPIFRFVLARVGERSDAEDLTQDVFVKVWRNMKRFDRTKNLKTWIFAIAKNPALDFLKKKKTATIENIEALADPEPPAQTFLEELIAGLLPKYQKVLVLRYREDFTFRTMAKLLKEPLHTIKSRHRRALLQLKSRTKTRPPLV